MDSEKSEDKTDLKTADDSKNDDEPLKSESAHSDKSVPVPAAATGKPETSQPKSELKPEEPAPVAVAPTAEAAVKEPVKSAPTKKVVSLKVKQTEDDASAAATTQAGKKKASINSDLLQTRQKIANLTP